MDITASRKIAWTTFLANIIILLHHANLNDYLPEKTGTYADLIMNFFSALSIPVMTYFFFISAFLFFRNFKMNQLRGKLKKRVKSLLIPYIVWNTFVVLLELIKNIGILKDPFFLIRNNYIFVNGTGCANGPLWYIFRLMEYVVLTPVIYFVLRNRNSIFAGVVCTILMAVNLIVGSGYYSFLYFLPIYVTGAYVGLNKNASFEAWLANKNESGGVPQKLCTTFVLMVLFCYITIGVSEYSILQLVFRYISFVPLLLFVHYASVHSNTPEFIANGGGCFYIVRIISCIDL